MKEENYGKMEEKYPPVPYSRRQRQDRRPARRLICRATHRRRRDVARNGRSGVADPRAALLVHVSSGMAAAHHRCRGPRGTCGRAAQGLFGGRGRGGRDTLRRTAGQSARHCHVSGSRVAGHPGPLGFRDAEQRNDPISGIAGGESGHDSVGHVSHRESNDAGAITRWRAPGASSQLAYRRTRSFR